MASNNPELPQSLLEQIPCNNDAQSAWLGASFTMRRNLARFPFPSKIPEHERAQLQNELVHSLQQQQIASFKNSIALANSSPSDRELIFEHFLFLQGFQEQPQDASIMLDEHATTLAFINGTDHLQLRALSPTPNWEEPWNQLAKLENQLDQSLQFAFSPKFGYLTSNPARCGTGLTAQIYLHLPALIQTKQLTQTLSQLEDAPLLITGIGGSLEEIPGDILVLQNLYTIGLSEENILHLMQQAATKLIGAETTKRAHLKEETDTEIKDRIGKAFGLINHAFVLKTEEALNLLSLLQLGHMLGDVEGVDLIDLRKAIFTCRRGYLSHLYPDIGDQKQLEHKRAEHLQQTLKSLKLAG